MAGAKPGVWRVQLKGVSVPKYMIDGEKFVKWEEDSGTGNPVTVRVDPHGHFLYWTNQNNEVETLDIAVVRDTRNGKGARIPKDPKLRQIVTLGSQDTLEEKTLTVVHGTDFVNITYINFCCAKKETAKMWAEELIAIATNLLQINSSIMAFLIKTHTRLTLLADRSGQVNVKDILKTFAKDKEDRKRVEKALDAAGLPSGKNDTINPSKFGFEEFFTFYKNLTNRLDIERVFDDFNGYNKKKMMTAEQFMDFINKEQRDPRLNEILYPYTTPDRATELIEMYEPNQYNAQRGLLSLDGFLRYILSDEGAIVSMEKFDLSDDMDHPLNHYFINSSHNTYLTGHQLTGKSSVEIYRQCLLSGCRCVELDFWNGSGRSEEPVIVHGYTLVPDIPAKDVIEAIAESAFKTSDYPVILSFENHCNQKQQAKIAQYCREFFGPMLLEVPLESHLLEPGIPLPPPSFLKRRIIIKNKKKHHHHHKQKPQKKSSKVPENGESPPPLTKDDSKESVDNEDPANDEESSISSDEEEDSTEPDDSLNRLKAEEGVDKSIQSDKGTAGKESEAGAEISALVNYVQPVHFYSFETSRNRNKSYEMSSFDEKQAMTLLKEQPIDFVNYNKHQLSRVYPRGTRVDSANFMPQLFWNAGCQLVALNFQTMDLAMQLNLGIFELNKRCGYLLKPEFMRRKDRKFDPFAESTVDGIIAGHVSIQVISGQFLTEKRVGTYVEVEMYGLPTDTVRKRFKTKMIPANGINPLYDEEPFVFKKVVLPDLACVRIAAYEESGKMLGHRVLPVVGLGAGYRHVILRNEAGQPVNAPTLFLNIRVSDFVPQGFSDFAEALANPIKYQSELEKRSKQLSVLQDDIAEDSSTNDDSEPIVNSPFPHPPLTSKPSVRVKKIGDSNPLMVSLPPAPGIFPGAAGVKPELAEEPGAKPKNPIMPTTSIGADLTTTGSNYLLAAAAVLTTEKLEKFLECKAVKEKRSEIDKKLEALRKKHEKDRNSKGPKKSHQKLVKKLSQKNLEVALFKKKDVPLSQSLIHDQIIIEKDTSEKGHEELSLLLEKTIKTAQSNQTKVLKSLEEKDNAELMKQIRNSRKDEFRKLKVTKDRNELDRMKRELDAKLVERGVQDRKQKKDLYDQFRLKMEKEHKEVFDELDEWKKSGMKLIEKEYTDRQQNLEVELKHSQNDPHSTNT